MNMKQPTKQQPANKAPEQKKPQGPAPAPASQQKKVPGK